MTRTITLVVLLLAAAAIAAGGVLLNTGVRFEFTDCASGGSAAQTFTDGDYLFRVTDADVFICLAATCAAGGEKFPSGTVMKLSVQAGSVSCRSSASTGDAIFTRSL